MQDKDDSALGKYIGEICKVEVLSEAEESELAARAQSGDRRALDRLVTANLRFVVSVANKYRGRGLAVEDLVSEGNIALVSAAAKFDASRGRFVSYAAPLVRRRMERAIEAQGEHYPQPDLSSRLAGVGGRTMSVDAPLGGREGVSLLATLAGTGEQEVGSNIDAERRGVVAAEALASLAGRERSVLAALYGIGCAKQTMAEAAENMGLKRERVRQIRDKAMRKLYKALRDARYSHYTFIRARPRARVHPAGWPCPSLICRFGISLEVVKLLLLPPMLTLSSWARRLLRYLRNVPFCNLV